MPPQACIVKRLSRLVVSQVVGVQVPVRARTVGVLEARQILSLLGGDRYPYGLRSHSLWVKILGFHPGVRSSSLRGSTVRWVGIPALSVKQ